MTSWNAGGPSLKLKHGPYVVDISPICVEALPDDYQHGVPSKVNNKP